MVLVQSRWNSSRTDSESELAEGYGWALTLCWGISVIWIVGGHFLCILCFVELFDLLFERLLFLFLGSWRLPWGDQDTGLCCEGTDSQLLALQSLVYFTPDNPFFRQEGDLYQWWDSAVWRGSSSSLHAVGKEMKSRQCLDSTLWQNCPDKLLLVLGLVSVWF